MKEFLKRSKEFLKERKQYRAEKKLKRRENRVNSKCWKTVQNVCTWMNRFSLLMHALLSGVIYFAIEAISSKGTDNITVPLSALILLILI